MFVVVFFNHRKRQQELLKSNGRSSIKRQQSLLKLKDVNKSIGGGTVKSSNRTCSTHASLVKTEQNNTGSQDLDKSFPMKKSSKDLHGSHREAIKISDDTNYPQSQLKLIEFVNDYSHLLPAQVLIQEGVSSIDGEIYLARNETLLLHFIKRTDIVILNAENEIYSVPINSSICFGLIYNPVETGENVSSYMQLPTVGDVMKLKQLPLLIAATASHNGGSPEKSVMEKEILFVKGVVRGTGIAKVRHLHVINTSNEEKFLSASCLGDFSTDPSYMKLHLSDLFAHDVELPQYVIIYPEGNMKANLPKNLSNCPVLLASRKEEVSVVATCGELRNAEESKAYCYVYVSLGIKLLQRKR